MLNLMGVADPDGEGMITRERLKRVAQWLTVRLTVALRRKAALPPGSLPAVPCRAVLSAAMLCDSVGTVGALARDASLIVHRLCDCRLGKYAWYTDRALARRDTSDDEAHRRYDP